MGKKKERQYVLDLVTKLEQSLASIDQRTQGVIAELSRDLRRLSDRVDRREVEEQKLLNAAEALVHAAERKWRSARSAEERVNRRRRDEPVEGDEEEDWPEELPGEGSDQVDRGGGGPPVPPVHISGPPSPPPDPTDVARAFKFRS